MPSTDRIAPTTGTTLYHRLTGKAPVEGAEAGVALRLVQRGELPLRPDDRYSAALAVAADVELWLADEPVAAYRERCGRGRGAGCGGTARWPPAPPRHSL